MLMFAAVVLGVSAMTADAAPSWTYTYAPGAIGAGNDVIPPQNMTKIDAESRCSALPRCQGITFHGSNTTTAVQRVYFKSSTGKSSDPSWSTYLKTGTVTPPTASLAVGGSSGLVVELRDTYFTVQSLNNTAVGQPPAGFGVKPSSYSFTRPLDQGSCLPLSVHLGDMTLRLQDASATDPLDSTFYTSAQIAAPAKVLPAGGAVLAAQDITAMVAGSAPTAAEADAFPLTIVRSYEKSSDGKALILRFNLSNTGSKPVRAVGLGFAMPESPGHPPAGIQETVWNDPHIGGDHGFVEFVRVVDEEATLLVAPEQGYHKSTKLEAWRPMLEDIAGTNAWEWTVHSTAWAAEWAVGAQTPFLNMTASTQGTPPMFPNAATPWPSCDGHEGFPILPTSKTPWNTPTDLVFKPAETVSFALRLQLAKAGPRTRNDALQSMGEPVLRGVPGYVLGSDMKSAKLLVLPPAGLTVVSANATSIGEGGGEINVGEMVTQGEYKAFPLTASGGRGRVTVVVTYSDGTTSAAHYMVLPAFAEQAAKVSNHYVNDAWLPRETVDPFGRSASMMPYDRETKTHVMDDARAYDVGLSDDAGGGNPLGSASRLKAMPNQELASRVDDYIKWTLYGIKPDTAKPPLRALQVLDPNGTDHDGNPLPESAYTSGNGQVDTDGIRMTMYYYGPDLGKTPSSGHFEYDYKEKDKCDRPFGGPTWCMTESMCNATYRGFNYPHHTSNYWALYHIARNHENIETHHEWQWYLERVAKTMMRGAHGGTGYMDGTVYRECLNALIEEGKLNETINEWATTLNESLHQRQEGWTHQPYPYGSEFGFDTTGQEEVVVWNLYYGNYTVAKYTVDHILSYMRSSATWAYNGGARSWGDAGNNAKWLTSFGTGFSERGQMHYRSGLNMIPLMEWYRTHPDELFLLEISMGAIAGQLVNIDENGATSMMWHAMPYVMDFDPHSGDFGLGFFGHCLETGAYYVLDKSMGELCYLCDVVSSSTVLTSTNGSSTEVGVTGSVTIHPRDSFHNRVFLEPLSLYLYAEAGTIDHVEFDLAGKKLSVVFESMATANVTSWTFKKIRLQVDKTSDARPGSEFVVTNSDISNSDAKAKVTALPFVRGAYEVDPASSGGETTVSVTWTA